VCGETAGRQWRPDSPNIPDAPSIVVLPVSLVNQFVSEFHVYIQPGTFDLMLYLGTWHLRRQWWTDIYPRSKQSFIQRVVVATSSVSEPTLHCARFCKSLGSRSLPLFLSQKAIESDLDCVLEFENSAPTSSPLPKAAFASLGSTTVFGYQWLVDAGDEVQRYRNVRRGYWSMYGVRERSETMVAMTATPVTTRTMVSLI
jgi:hypothetical protein